MTGAGNMTTAEACDYLGCTRSTLYRLAREFRVRRPRRTRASWPRRELDRIIEARRVMR